MFFYENMLGNLLGFHRMNEKNIFFCFYFFLKEEINLKFFEFSIFFKKSFGENWYFNTRFVSYSINIQPDTLK